MASVCRNAPCPCGSGKKYKKCCGTKPAADHLPKDSSSEPIGLQPGVRMKGGVMFAPESGGYVAIVHSWDNVECRGEPSEWRGSRVFPTEDAAMQYIANLKSRAALGDTPGVIMLLFVKNFLFTVLVPGTVAVFHLFVVLYEEPRLARQFGESYERYCRAVHRWIPGRPYEQAV